MDETDVIRERLKRQRLSYVWLIYQLKRCGLRVSKSEVSSIFAGTRSGPKANSVLETSKTILDDYEHRFINGV